MGDSKDSAPISVNHDRRGFARWDVRFSALCVLFTVAVVYLFIEAGPDPGWRRTLAVVTWFGWVLLPPLYFLGEWTLYRGDAAGEPFERLKHRQHLASQFWVAGVTALSVVLFQAGALKGSDTPSAAPDRPSRQPAET